MSQLARTIAAAVFGSLFGLAVGCLSVYYFFIQPVLETYAKAEYHSTITEADRAASQLHLLREGKVEALASSLEGYLDAQILRASTFEEMAPYWRDQQAENAISRVREYRLTYPLPNRDKAFQEKLTKVLAPKPHESTAP